jgi:ABC-type sugar transport system permease subunit
VGLRNWSYLSHDPAAYLALANTLWLIAVMVPVRMLFALGLAQLVIRLRRGAPLVRAAFFLPCLVPPVAATVVFVFVLNPATGPVDTVLGLLGGEMPDWFNDPGWAKPALTLLALWGVGDLMVIMMAALLDVPSELYEAAALDGAGRWQRFRFVTLPAIAPVLLFAAVTGVVQTLQYYTQPWVAGTVASGVALQPGAQIPPGHPGGSTLTVAQLIFDAAFRQYQAGYACALAVLLFALAAAFAAVLFRRTTVFGEAA